MNFLIVGLGNIGAEYAGTRHNIGFMVLDEFAKKHALSFTTDRHAAITQFNTRGHHVFLIKPSTFMNLSGKALTYWMQQLKIPIENTLVIVDDLAIPFQTVKLKPKGADAGHNGLKNINLMLGHSNYPRIRFGIGDNYPKGRQVDYVLSAFDKTEQPYLPELIDKAIQMVESFIAIGVELTMTKLN